MARTPSTSRSRWRTNRAGRSLRGVAPSALAVLLMLTAGLPLKALEPAPHAAAFQAEGPSAEGGPVGALGSWLYNRPVSVDNTGHAGALSDYQVLVTVDTAALIAAGKMRADCGDARFLKDGALLSYWIEGPCNTRATRFWVKVPSLEGGAFTTLTLEYGNPDAASASDGDATFLFFDDFNDAGFTEDWQVVDNTGGQGSAVQRDGKLVLTQFEVSRRINVVSLASFAATFAGGEGAALDYAVHTRYDPPNFGWVQEPQAFLLDGANSARYVRTVYSAFRGDLYLTDSAGLAHLFGTTVNGQSNVVATSRVAADANDARARWQETSGGSRDFTGGIASSALAGATSVRLKLEVFTGGSSPGAGARSAFDDVRLRNVATPEPAATVGEEGLACEPGAFPGSPTLTLASNPLAGRPGGAASGRLSLYAEATRTFTLRAALPGPGWTFSLQGAAVGVCGGATRSQSFNIGIPSSAPAGQTFRIPLTAETGGLTLRAEQSVSVRQPYFIVEFTASWAPATNAFDVAAKLFDLRSGKYIVPSASFTLRTRLLDPATGEEKASATLAAGASTFSGAVGPVIQLGSTTYTATVTATDGAGVPASAEQLVTTAATGSGKVLGTVLDENGQAWQGGALRATLWRQDRAWWLIPLPIDSASLLAGVNQFTLSAFPDGAGGYHCVRCLLRITDADGDLLGFADVIASAKRDVSITVFAAERARALGGKLAPLGDDVIAAMKSDTEGLLRMFRDARDLDNWDATSWLKLADFVVGATTASKQILKGSTLAQLKVASKYVAIKEGAEFIAPQALEAEIDIMLTSLWQRDPKGYSTLSDPEIEKLLQLVRQYTDDAIREIMQRLKDGGSTSVNDLLSQDARTNPAHPFYSNPLVAAVQHAERDKAGLPSFDWPLSEDFDPAYWLQALRTLQRAARDGSVKDVDVAGWCETSCFGGVYHPPHPARLGLREAQQVFDAFKGMYKTAREWEGRVAGLNLLFGLAALGSLFIFPPAAAVLLTASTVVAFGTAPVSGTLSAFQNTARQEMGLRLEDGADWWGEQMVAEAGAYHALIESLEAETRNPVLYNKRLSYAGTATAKLQGAALAAGTMPTIQQRVGLKVSTTYPYETVNPRDAAARLTDFQVTVDNDSTRDGAPTKVPVAITLDATVRSPQLGTPHAQTIAVKPCIPPRGMVTNPCFGVANQPRSFTRYTYPCSETREARGRVPPSVLSDTLQPGEVKTITVPYLAFWNGVTCHDGGSLGREKATTHIDYTVKVYVGPRHIATYAFTVCAGPYECEVRTVQGLGAASAEGAGALGADVGATAVEEEVLTLSSDAPVATRSVALPAGLGRSSFAVLGDAAAEVVLSITDSQGKRLGFDPATGEVAQELFGQVEGGAEGLRNLDLLAPPAGTYEVGLHLLSTPDPSGTTAVRLVREDVPDGAADLAAEPAALHLGFNAEGASQPLSVVVSESSGLFPLTGVVARAAPLRLDAQNQLGYLSATDVDLGTLEAGEARVVTLRLAPCGAPCPLRSGTYAGSLEVEGKNPAGERRNLTVPIVVDLDTTAPVTTPTFAPAAAPGEGALYVGPDHEVTLPAADDLSGVLATYGGEAGAVTLAGVPVVFEGASRATELVAFSVDNAGNVEPEQRVALRYDADPPATALVPGPGAFGAYVSPATDLALEATDPVVNGVASGVASSTYAIDGGADGPYTGAFRLAGPDGPRDLAWASVDRVGNAEARRTGRLLLDGTHPETALDVGDPQHVGTGTFVNQRTPLALLAVDPEVNGVASGVQGREARLEFSADGGATWTLVVDWTELILQDPFHPPSTDGTYGLDFRSRDNVLNLEPDRRREVRVDNTPPRTTASFEGPTAAGVHTFVGPATRVVLDALDPVVNAVASGVAATERRLEFSGDGGATWQLVEDWGPAAPRFGLVGPDGMYRIGFRSLDNLGNREADQELVVFLDATPPELAFEPGAPSAGLFVAPQSLNTLRSTDPVVGGGASGVAATRGAAHRVQGPGGEAPLPPGAEAVRFRLLADDGRYDLRVATEDRVGNAREASFSLLVDGTGALGRIAAPRAGAVCAGPTPDAVQCAPGADGDGDGFADDAEAFAGSDADRPLWTPVSPNHAANPGFEAAEQGHPAASWRAAGALAWLRTGENAPWTSTPPSGSAELRAKLRDLLEDAYQGPPSMVEAVEKDVFDRIRGFSPGFTNVDNLVATVDQRVHELAPGAPRLRLGQAGANAARWLFEQLSQPGQAEAQSLEARGEGLGSLSQDFAADAAGGRPCGLAGVGLDLLPDPRLRGLSVAVAGTTFEGAPVQLTARLGPAAWKAGEWNQLSVSALAMDGAEAAPASGSVLLVCVHRLALEFDAGAAASPLDEAAARLDNVLLHALARSPAAAHPALGLMPRLPVGPVLREPVVQGLVELRVEASDPAVAGVASGLGCVRLEAIDPDGPRAAWDTCDGTLQAAPGGGYRALWDTAGFDCRVTLRLSAPDALGRGALRERSVAVAAPAGVKEVVPCLGLGATLPPLPGLPEAPPEPGPPEVPPLPECLPELPPEVCAALPAL